MMNYINNINKIDTNITYVTYTVNNDLELYIRYSNKKLSYKSLLKILSYKNDKLFNNNFNVDHYFYKYINNIQLLNKNQILDHISMYGFENGLIYHPKQLINLFQNIKFFEDNKKNIIIEYNHKKEDIRTFVKRELYDKNFNWYLENFIKTHESNIIDNELLLIVFIGNNTVGTILLDKIIEYKKIQPNFILSVCFKNNELYELYKNKIIENFNNYILYTTTDFGTDIIPSLLVYNNIKKNINFNKIIKLQTKGDIEWFNELTNYLLTKNLKELIIKHNTYLDICNCLGNPNKCMSTFTRMEVMVNSRLNIKYRHLTKKKYFIAGTIFFCDKIVFEKVLNFIKNNNYRSYFTNNLYDTNIINVSNSLIHYLERLFGIIDIN